jgi:hypothetical protein
MAYWCVAQVRPKHEQAAQAFPWLERVHELLATVAGCSSQPWSQR